MITVKSPTFARPPPTPLPPGDFNPYFLGTSIHVHVHVSGSSFNCNAYSILKSYAPISVKPLRGRPGKGGGFDSNHRPVVGSFDRFNGLSSNIVLTVSCYFDNPQCPGWGI